jgi:hypothetical protein
MVDNSRHAAGHTTYEVHEVLEGDPAVDLGLRFSASDFSEAIELALDYLQTNDPSRGQVSALQILRVTGHNREVVWSYSHKLAVAARDDLVSLWGFNPTQSWQLPSA